MSLLQWFIQEHLILYLNNYFFYKRGLLIINLKIKTYFLFHIGYDLFLKKSDWFNEIFMIYKMYVYGK